MGLKSGLARGKAYTVAQLGHYPNVSWPTPPGTRPTQPRNPGGVAKVLVEQGRIRGATRCLVEPSSPLDLDDGTNEHLRAKHPRGANQPFQNPPRMGRRSSPPNEESLQNIVKAFPSDSAPGPSGLTPQLFKLVNKSPKVGLFLFKLTSLSDAGTAPGRSFLCSSRGVALPKADGSLRPIAIGELIYRMYMMCILRLHFKAECLLPFQYGVDSRGGVEPVVHAVEFALEDRLQKKCTHLTPRDFSNAFNSVDRGTSKQASTTSCPRSTRRPSGRTTKSPTSFRRSQRPSHTY